LKIENAHLARGFFSFFLSFFLLKKKKLPLMSIIGYSACALGNSELFCHQCFISVVVSRIVAIILFSKGLELH